MEAEEADTAILLWATVLLSHTGRSGHHNIEIEEMIRNRTFNAEADGVAGGLSLAVLGATRVPAVVSFLHPLTLFIFQCYVLIRKSRYVD